MRRVGSDPGAPPPNLIKHQPWVWAADPRWSEEGGWIYFLSHRLTPQEPSLWRVPATGGEEELVSRHSTHPPTEAGVDRVEVRSGELRLYMTGEEQPRVIAEGLPARSSISPDGRWAVAWENRSPELRIFSLPSGDQQQVTPEGSWLRGEEMWHGAKLSFLTAIQEYDGSALLSVLDAAEGEVTHYVPPTPTQGRLWPLGWVSDHRVLVRVLPLSDRYLTDPAEADAAPTGTWLLDLNQYEPPGPAEPTGLRAVKVGGPVRWEQMAGDGPVTGGEVKVGAGSAITLRYDRPLDPDWIRREVSVTGPGRLETRGALLGLAIIRLDEAQPGETVRVASPTFDFDLQVEIDPELDPEGRIITKLQVRSSDGRWEAADPGKRWPQGPLDLRLLFSHPVDRESIRGQLLGDKSRILPAGATAEWVGEALQIHLPEPPGAIRIPLNWLSQGLPPVYVGPAPRLVAAALEGEQQIVAVPPEVMEATVTEGLLQIRHWSYTGDAYDGYRQTTGRVDLETGQYQDDPEIHPVPGEGGLRPIDRHGGRIAGIEPVRQLGPADGYLYEGDLVVRDREGEEIVRLKGLRSGGVGRGPGLRSPDRTGYLARGGAAGRVG